MPHLPPTQVPTQNRRAGTQPRMLMQLQGCREWRSRQTLLVGQAINGRSREQWSKRGRSVLSTLMRVQVRTLLENLYCEAPQWRVLDKLEAHILLYYCSMSLRSGESVLLSDRTHPRECAIISSLSIGWDSEWPPKGALEALPPTQSYCARAVVNGGRRVTGRAPPSAMVPPARRAGIVAPGRRPTRRADGRRRHLPTNHSCSCAPSHRPPHPPPVKE